MPDGLKIYPTAQLREMIEETAADHTVPAHSRRRELEILSEHLQALQDRCTQYLTDLQTVEEAEHVSASRIRMEARHNADLREQMIKRGFATPERMDELGYLSHEALDAAEDRGDLEESVLGALKGFGLGLLQGPAFERMVRRDRTGRFIDKPGPTVSTAPRVRSRATSPPSLPRAAGSRPTRVRRADKPAPSTKRIVPAPARGGESVAAIHNHDIDASLLALHANLSDDERRKRIHPALTREAYAAMKERKYGTERPEVHATRAELDAKMDRLRAEGFTEEEVELIRRSDEYASRETVRAQAYEERKKRLDRRTDKLARQGVAENTEAENTFNAAGRTGQAAMLRYIEDALSAPSTTDLHTHLDDDGERVWDADRADLHDTIIDLLMRQRKTVPDPDKPGKTKDIYDGESDYIEPPDGPPQVLFMGGGYAAGKGSVRKILQKEGKVPENALVIDPDEIKALLPEYDATLEGDPEANMRVYEEAWEVAQELQRAAQARGINVIVDGITDTSADEVEARIQSFNDAGYENPRVVYVDIPTQEAIKRAGLRALNAKDASDRRHIPEVIMRSVHRDIGSTVPEVLQRAPGLGASVEVWNNHQGKDDEGNFRPPKRFAVATPSDYNVEDRELFDSFLNKSQEEITGVEGPKTIRERAARYLAERLDLNGDAEPPRGDTANEVLGTFASTMEKWSIPDPSDPTNPSKRIWDAERRAEHIRIRDSFFVKRDENGKPIMEVDEETGEEHEAQLDIPDPAEREALFMVGITASGKSTALKSGDTRTPPDAVEVNTDDTREQLTEFKAMAEAQDRYSGQGTHDEAKTISQMVMTKALAQGNNVVVDGVGDKEADVFYSSMRKMMSQEKGGSPGYQVTALVTDLDREKAKERSLERFLSSGRYVPEAVIDNYDDHVALRHLEWREDPNLGWEGYNTDVAKGEAPKLMARKLPGGDIQIISPELYAQFLKKAEWAREREEETT